ncbi:uncharacterized protein LOC103355549 [Stegastes partitus]|uniref:Uncharacterized protein LOC103355549 n=1 Tax=Stegastes partitus TaxID=144197 RepID=A0A9Y4JK71_9TELE|nr:PREDICTED: uncharacterized protein LOC103355549 [Stegastes partitus]
MVDNIVTKPLGFVLIVTAHMVFNGPSHAAVIGSLGDNITLSFTFPVKFKKDSVFGLYTTGEQKIIDNKNCRSCFDIFPGNSSVFYHITNLSRNHSKTYWVSVILKTTLIENSDNVSLIVREQSRSTATPVPTEFTTPEGSGSSSINSFHIVSVLAVSPVVLLAAALPVLIYCFAKTRDKQQQQMPRHSSNPTVQEIVEPSSNVPAPSLVYSVLDFPKRLPAPVEMNPSDTEYAAVSYLPEMRRM